MDVQVIKCEDCPKVWERPWKSGPKPKTCESCKKQRRAQANATWYAGTRGKRVCRCGEPVTEPRKSLCGDCREKPRAERKPRATHCIVEPCPKRRKALGYCATHWRRYKLHGDPGPAELLRAPMGGGHVNSDGYYVIRVDGRSVLEHRHVMEQMLGRKLLPGENVHHKKNGDRTDNRPENLELWSTFQPPGQRVSDKIEWALELLALYAPELLAANVSAVA